MLQNEADPIDWTLERNKAIDHLPNDLKPYILKENLTPTSDSVSSKSIPQKG